MYKGELINSKRDALKIFNNTNVKVIKSNIHLIFSLIEYYQDLSKHTFLLPLAFGGASPVINILEMMCGV